MTKAFAQHFSSVYVADTMVSSNTCPTNENNNDTEINMTSIRLTSASTADVSLVIKQLKPKKSLGPDKIPPYIYKGLREYLISPLTYIFNLCIATKKFSTTWKVSKVTPVSKSDSSVEISNHRPIALSLLPAKIFEYIIHK